MKLLAGNSNPPLAKAISEYLEMPLTDVSVRRFADEEVFVEVNENVRGEDVFVIQSTSYPANDNLMELLICIDALRRASAKRITAVLPYFGYARQDRKPGPRTPISAKLVANLITTAGANRVLSIDLHAGQIQGFFDIPTDNLFASPVIATDINARFANRELIVVSPDVRRHDHEIFVRQPCLDVGRDHWRSEEVVRRNVEETLDLPGVQVDRQDAVRTRGRDQIRDELGRDRSAWAGFPVLPRIAEIGEHRGDPRSRRAAKRVDHDQKLHQIVVGRIAGRLDDEDVLAADILVDLDENLLVGEPADTGLGQRQLEIIGDRAGQRRVAVPGEQFHVMSSPASEPQP